jgi:drug/metabolite transporter (DMT)-like permease
MSAGDKFKVADPVVGVLLVLASTAAFAFGPVGARVAFEDGSNTLTVVALRGVVAAVLMSLLIGLRREGFAMGRAAWQWCLGCGLLQAVVVYGFIGSVASIPVSVAVLVFFTHPILVALFAHWFGSERLTLRKGLLAVLVLVGLALALGAEASTLDPYGLGLAVLASGAMVGMILCVGRAQQLATSTQVNLYATAASTVAFAAMATVVSGWAMPASATGWVGIAGAGAGIGIGLLALFAAFHYLSAVRATMLSSIEPLVTIALAAVVLGERLAPIQWVGATLVVGSLALFEAVSRAQQAELS